MAEPTPPTGVREHTWVDIDSSQDIVVTGLRTILETGLGASICTTAGAVDGEPDVVLFDVTALDEGVGSERLDRLVSSTGSVVIAVTLDGLRPDLEALALQCGAVAAIPLGISAEGLVEVIQAVIAGELAGHPVVRTRDGVAYPGQEAGLSERESQVVALIVQGKSNQEIAQESFLSINSVKTYISNAYRKLGLSSRTQVVAWGIRQGLPIESTQKSFPSA